MKQSAHRESNEFLEILSEQNTRIGVLGCCL
jgi:hypothetical protein